MRRVIERIFITLGLFGLGLVGAAYLHAALGSRAAIAAFEQAAKADTQQVLEFGMADFTPDQSLWSDTARAKYAKARNDQGLPLALLKIGRLNLEAPVFAGTDRMVLNRGLGVVEGTALPGEIGNVVISGHRDSFFRPLKDIEIGDAIELRTLDGVQEFRVAGISIVDPFELSVLDPADTAVLTLITCYPFYYVGYAPDRFIVRATPAEK